MKVVFLHTSLVVCSLWLFTALNTARANDIAVTNITLTGQNIPGGYTLVQFDISWENSWRDAINWDAAWVFVKVSANGGSWHHFTLIDIASVIFSGTPVIGITRHGACNSTAACISRRFMDMPSTQANNRWAHTTFQLVKTDN